MRLLTALAGAVLVACALPAHAEDPGTDLIALRDTQPPPRPSRDGWQEIKRLEMVFQVLNAADFITTNDCLRRDVCHEVNPLIGRNPSTAKLAAIKIGSGAAHYVIARHLARRDPDAARLFEYVSIGATGAIVMLNLRFTFKRGDQ